MLLGNYSIANKNPGREYGQANPLRYYKESTVWQKFNAESNVADESRKAAIPNGYIPPYSLLMPQKAGGLSSNTQINGVATVTTNLSQGINIVSDLEGSGSLTAGLSLVTSMIATIAGSGSLTGNMVGAVQMAADLAGSGAVTASLKMLSGLIADLSGSGAISADLKGKLFMEANIYVNEGQATVDQIVQGVVDNIGSITATVPPMLNTETGDIIIPLD